MNFHDPKVLIGGGVLLVGVAYFFLRSPSASASDGYAPSLISYVSPGDKDATVAGSASTSTSSGGDLAGALSASTISSNDTNLSVLNTESLLTNVSALVNSQVSKLPFKTDYGFTSSVKGGITLDKAGAPQFTFESAFTPKDISTSAAQIRSLNKQVTGWKARYEDAIAKLKTANKPPVKKP